MNKFYQYWTQLDPDKAFPMFGSEHLFLLLTVGIVLHYALKGISKASPKRARRVIYICAVAEPLLELGHTVWLYQCGQTDWVKLLPLHLCAMQAIFIPLAVFSGKTLFRDFIFSTAVLGGLFGILFPAGVAGSYPLWHYQTLQTVALHSLLIFIPLALIAAGEYRPSVKRFPRVLLLFCVVALVAAVVDYQFGENYMFLNAPPEGTPLVWIFEHFGKGWYLMITFCVLAGMSLLTYLPFAGKKSMNFYKKKEEAVEKA